MSSKKFKFNYIAIKLLTIRCFSVIKGCILYYVN